MENVDEKAYNTGAISREITYSAAPLVFAGGLVVSKYLGVESPETETFATVVNHPFEVGLISVGPATASVIEHKSNFIRKRWHVLALGMIAYPLGGVLGMAADAIEDKIEKREIQCVQPQAYLENLGHCAINVGMPATGSLAITTLFASSMYSFKREHGLV